MVTMYGKHLRLEAPTLEEQYIAEKHIGMLGHENNDVP
jgi:hypothetical protein